MARRMPPHPGVSTRERKKHRLAMEEKLPQRGLSHWFSRVASGIANFTGRPWAFLTAIVVILVWAITGPIFGFSDTWQLVINTGTTVVTFLMVFLIQQTQNKESLAVQVKLDELIAAIKGASNRLIGIEDLTEEEVRELHDRYHELARKAQNAADMCRSLSIEEAEGEN